jgi:hypothetical protein
MDGFGVDSGDDLCGDDPLCVGRLRCRRRHIEYQWLSPEDGRELNQCLANITSRTMVKACSIDPTHSQKASRHALNEDEGAGRVPSVMSCNAHSLPSVRPLLRVFQVAHRWPGSHRKSRWV